MPAIKPLPRQSQSDLTKSSKRSASCPTRGVPQTAPPTTPPPSPVVGGFSCMLSLNMSTSRAASGKTPPPPQYEQSGQRHLSKLPSPYLYPLAYNQNGEIIDPSIDSEAWSLSSSTAVQTASHPEDRFPLTKKSITRCVMRFTGVYIFLALSICTPLFFFYRWFIEVCNGPASEFYREYAWHHDYPTVGHRPGFYWSIVAIIYSSLGPILNHFAFGVLENWVADYIREAPEGEIIGPRTHENCSAAGHHRKGRESCRTMTKEWGATRRILRQVYWLQQGTLYLLAVALLPIVGIIALLTLAISPAKLV